jgi:transcriptional regulator with XRE-family HTH domain
MNGKFDEKENLRKALKGVEFFQLLESNELSTPNEFTCEMGDLIRKAREERGLSQVDFATKTNRRPATISNIENGKSDISVLTLVLFAIKLEKPLSYFFPEDLLKDQVVDIKTEFEHAILEKVRGIEVFGDKELTLSMVNLLYKYFSDEYDNAFNDHSED